MCGLALVALTWAAIATARDLPASLPRHLLLYVSAGLAWLAGSIVVLRLPASRAGFVVVALVALALRVPAWLGPPAHSDDVHRYLWDGEVQRAGINPYRYPPDAPELVALRDDNWGRINNRALPTIYPPLAEAAFAASPSLGVWKLVVALGGSRRSPSSSIWGSATAAASCSGPGRRWW